jgi:magnesium transporter
VLGVSMVLNLVIAGFFGPVIPLAMDRIGKGPATSATIFITTATDVLEFFTFLGLARARCSDRDRETSSHVPT